MKQHGVGERARRWSFHSVRQGSTKNVGFFRDRNAKIHLAIRGECKNPSAHRDRIRSTAGIWEIIISALRYIWNAGNN